MKKIIYMCAMLAFLLSSCVSEVDDVFSETATKRIQKRVEELQTLLKAPEYGWVMEYYPHAKQTFGGYVFTMKFEENEQVTISGELSENVLTSKTSLYTINTDMGPTLNFDTYNEIFHYLADPDPHGQSKYGFYEQLTSGYGFEGDYEFVIESYSSDEVILKGKKTKNMIRMTTLKEPAPDYLTKILKVSEEMYAASYLVDMGGTVSNVAMTDHVFTFKSSSGESVAAPYIITPEGIKFYTPITVDGRTMENFIWNNENRTMTCVDKGATDVVMTALPLPDSYIKFNDFLGKWIVKYSNAAVEVELQKVTKNKLLVMKGFNPNFDIVVQYDTSVGGICILSQTIKRLENGNSVVFAAWNANTGSLWMNTQIGMVSKKRVASSLIVDLVDNGMWTDGECNSWIIWEMAGNQYVGSYTEWGSGRYVGYFSMEKK